MKIIIVFVFFMLLYQNGFSNNIQVSNVRLTGQDTAGNFSLVEFDISWENSWRYSGGPANWDASWIFVKYRVGVAGEWKHAWLNNTGHQSCTNTTIENGLLTPGETYHNTTNPVLGIFLYRATSGTGTFICQNVQLRWNYNSNNVADDALVDIRVFALEMVYIPQSSFYVGTEGTTGFYTYPTITEPYQITSEGAIPVGASNGSLYYNTGGDQSGPIPAAYPKGYNAFYAMKYEISQQAYVDFLNTLNRSQQAERSNGLPGTGSSNIKYVLNSSSIPSHRNYVACPSTYPAAPSPVEFLVDYFNNNTPGSIEGTTIACNYLSYADVAAYLDWSALRLMTEFEYEKCGRGNAESVNGEFAWGNLYYYYTIDINDEALPTEYSTHPLANLASNIHDGPLRVGIFANDSSNRVKAGAGFYGCLDISGNVYERAVNIGFSESRSYTGQHGDGLLSGNGNMDVFAWPNTYNAGGICRRGGSFGSATVECRISNRYNSSGDAYRHASFGGRGVRTAG